MVRLRAKRYHVRNEEQNTGRFQNGHGRGGRKPGSKNRMTRLLKDGIEEALIHHGDWLAENMKSKRMQELYGVGGMVGALTYLQRHEGSSFVALLARLLPMQVTGKIEGSVEHNHRAYETPEEVMQALRDRGLPPPMKMIDITPERDTEE